MSEKNEMRENIAVCLAILGVPLLLAFLIPPLLWLFDRWVAMWR